MNIYFATILDHQGAEVMRLEWTSSAKHSAFLATQFINLCPPAQGFRICKRFIESKEITRILNREL